MRRPQQVGASNQYGSHAFPFCSIFSQILSRWHNEKAMRSTLLKLVSFLIVSIMFTSEMYAENGIVRQYRKETGFPNSFILVTEYENGNSMLVTYSVCSQCKGTKKCGACYGRGGVYIGEITGYIPCIACGRTGVCGACDSNGLAIIGSMLVDSDGNIIGSSSMYGNSGSDSRSGNKSTTQSSCRYCNGTGYFLQQSSTPGTFVGHTPLYNSSGSKCRICGRYNEHWHLQCKH